MINQIKKQFKPIRRRGSAPIIFDPRLGIHTCSTSVLTPIDHRGRLEQSERSGTQVTARLMHTKGERRTHSQQIEALLAKLAEKVMRREKAEAAGNNTKAAKEAQVEHNIRWRLEYLETRMNEPTVKSEPSPESPHSKLYPRGWSKSGYRQATDTALAEALKVWKSKQ